jgi:hypothetical protein
VVFAPTFPATCDTDNPSPITTHYGLIPLLGHAQLPSSWECQGSAEATVKHQPKHRQASPEDEMSSISRGHTVFWWSGRGSNPRPTDYESAYLDGSRSVTNVVAQRISVTVTTGRVSTVPTDSRSFWVTKRRASSRAATRYPDCEHMPASTRCAGVRASYVYARR